MFPIPKMEDGFFVVKEQTRMLSKFAAPVVILLIVVGVWEGVVHLLRCRATFYQPLQKLW